MALGFVCPGMGLRPRGIQARCKSMSGSDWMSKGRRPSPFGHPPFDGVFARDPRPERRGSVPGSDYFLNPSLKASPIRRAASVMVSTMSFAPSA